MNLLSIQDFDVKEINDIFELSYQIKNNSEKFSSVLGGKSFVLVFQKPSNRTRVSFEIGISKMGGHSIYLNATDIGLGKREPIKDIARVLSRYCDGIIARTYSHDVLTQFKDFSSVPVINALSDLEHPCQALADIFTLYDKGMDLSSIKFTYLGDGNNVLNSLLLLCSKLGINITMAIPEKYKPKNEILTTAEKFSSTAESKIKFVSDPKIAVKDADVLYTDVWVSMGQESESKDRHVQFDGYQINNQLITLAKDKCAVMHCLPAHRGEEITDDVIESKNSIVFDQAENRLYIQQAILLHIMGLGKVFLNN